MKLSVKVILITFINTMFLNCIITSNVLMHLFPRNAYIISFLLGIFVTLLYLIIPTKNTNFQSKVLNSKFTRIILIFYIIISTVLITLSSIKILSDYFFFLTPTFLIIAVLLFFVALVGSVNIHSIMNIMLILFVILLITSQIHFLNTNTRDFRLLLPISFYFKKPYLALVLLFPFLDNLLFFTIPSVTSNPPSKWNFVIGSLIGSMLSTWFIMDNYLFLDYRFFDNMLFPSLFRYRLYTGPKYFEHLDIFLCIYICSYIFIKLTLNLEILRQLFKKQNTFIYRLGTCLFLGAIITFLFYNYVLNHSFIIITSLISTILILIFYFTIWRYAKNDG